MYFLFSIFQFFFSFIQFLKHMDNDKPWQWVLWPQGEPVKCNFTKLTQKET